MKLTLQTPDRSLTHENVDFMTLPGLEGIVGVLPNHAPMIIQLASGVVHLFREDNCFENYFINPGMLHITPTQCTLLTERAQHLDELDPVLLKEKLQAYHDDLAGMDLDWEQRYIERQIRITRNMLRALNTKDS